MNRSLRMLFAVSVTTGAVLAGGSAAAGVLHAASTPGRVSTPVVKAASVAPRAVEAHQTLPTVDVNQALPVTARTAGSMPIQGAWDRQTPQAVEMHQPLGRIDVAQTVPDVSIGAITVNLPAGATYDVSSNGVAAGVSSNIVGTDAAVSTNGPALADISTSALSLNNKLQVAKR